MRVPPFMDEALPRNWRLNSVSV